MKASINHNTEAEAQVNNKHVVEITMRKITFSRKIKLTPILTAMEKKKIKMKFIQMMNLAAMLAATMILGATGKKKARDQTVIIIVLTKFIHLMVYSSRNNLQKGLQSIKSKRFHILIT